MRSTSRGFAIDTATVDELLAVDTAAWRQEASEIGKYLDSYGARLPAAMREELARLAERGSHLRVPGRTFRTFAGKCTKCTTRHP